MRLDISIDGDCIPVQPRLKKFPIKSVGSQWRKSNAAWHALFPSLEYSVERDSAFCFVGRHFSKNYFNFVAGFSDWVNTLKNFRKHTASLYHCSFVENHSTYITTYFHLRQLSPF